MKSLGYSPTDAPTALYEEKRRIEFEALVEVMADEATRVLKEIRAVDNGF